MGLDALAEHISERSGVGGTDEIQDFQEWYDNQGFGNLDSLKPLRMFLIGLGADDRTERMVKFLAENSGLDISLLTSHVFNYDGKTILAKQVEVEGGDEFDLRPPRQSRSREERLELLIHRAEEFGVRDLFAAVRRMFQENWPGLSERISRKSIGLWLQWPTDPEGLRYYSNGLIFTEEDKVSIHFYEDSVDLCADEFSQRRKDIPSEEWSNGDVLFLLTSKEWEEHKQSLITLTRSIYDALQKKIQDDGADSA